MDMVLNDEALPHFGIWSGKVFDKAMGLTAMKPQGRFAWGRPSSDLAHSLSHDQPR